jgi:hypothetical protein
MYFDDHESNVAVAEVLKFPPVLTTKLHRSHLAVV